MPEQSKLDAEEPHNVIEDLPVNEEQKAEIKGGPIFVKYEGVDGDVTSIGFDRI